MLTSVSVQPDNPELVKDYLDELVGFFIISDCRRRTSKGIDDDVFFSLKAF